jgi:hypothetical protein
MQQHFFIPNFCHCQLPLTTFTFTLKKLPRRFIPRRYRKRVFQRLVEFFFNIVQVHHYLLILYGGRHIDLQGYHFPARASESAVIYLQGFGFVGVGQV